MKSMRSNQGFTLVEILVVTMLMSVILGTGFMLFVAGQNAFSLSSMRAELQENSRRTLQRISYELQESGVDNLGNLKVSVVQGGGVNGTDLLRFSVPMCVCGMSPIDSNGNVSKWGAPTVWGNAGCSTNYPTGANGKVDICHLPPGNPGNTQDLNVAVDAVKAHLAHGDRLGACNSCDPVNYTNRTVEYQINSSGQLLRRVLNSANGVVNSVVMAQRLTDFQVQINGTESVAVSIQLVGTASGGRILTVANSMDVILRN